MSKSENGRNRNVNVRVHDINLEALNVNPSERIYCLQQCETRDISTGDQRFLTLF